MGITRHFNFEFEFEGDTYSCKAKRMQAKDGVRFDSLYMELTALHIKIMSLSEHEDFVDRMGDLRDSQEQILSVLSSMLEVSHRYMRSWDLCEEDGDPIPLPREVEEFIELCNELGSEFVSAFVGGFLGGHRALGKPKSEPTSSGPKGDAA